MRILPYARLLRLPNVFTAFADIAMASCVVSTLAFERVDESGRSLAVVMLLLASGCLYLGGMVWNDYFDLEEDRRDRPFRPLPSKQIPVRTAVILGIALFVMGLLFASAGWLGSLTDNRLKHPGAAILACLLIVAILLYDAWLKRTRYGPISMGACRFLNVLLGLSYADFALIPLPWNIRFHLAGTVGLYIAGVTWFARTEEKRSDPKILQKAGIVLLAALVSALAVPIHVPPGASSPLFPYLLVCFGFFIGIPVVTAIRQPTPEHVQAGVKRCILGLVALDALLAMAFVGTPGLLILLLLPPALLLGKWVYST